MAYGVKYRVEFKDIDNTDVKYDILEEGYSSSITDLKPSSDPLTIEWPSVRGDIFNPIRGAIASLSFYASEIGQFYEFFDANTLQYKVIVYYDGDVYWSGFLMLANYLEVMKAPPYIVNIQAYDLGFLQSSNWNVTKHGADSIVDTIQTILTETNLSLEIKERVDIKEDSVNPNTAVSILNNINIHQASFIDDNWNSVTLYEALSRLLLSFNSFIIQENNYWNICRVGDMRISHYYRIFNTSGSVISSGSEDLRSDLSSYLQLHVNSVLLSGANYRKLNMTQHEIVVNLVNNGMVNYIGTASDYWNSAGSFFYDTWVFYRAINYLRINSLIASIPVVVHENTYNVYSGTLFDFYCKWEVHCGTGTANKVRIEISVVGGSTYYLNMATGAWSNTSSVADISFTSTSHKYGTVDFETSSIPIDGVLNIKLSGATGTGANEAYYKMNLTPVNVSNYAPLGTRNLTETIDADSLEDSPQIDFYYGDARDEEGKDVLLGSLKVISTGNETDLWQTKSGSPINTLLQLARDCYEAQYRTAAKRIQAELKGDLDYLSVLTFAGGEYLASSITRNFGNHTLDGEWIEIKIKLGSDLTGVFINGAFGTDLYDIFSTSGNEVSITKTQQADFASCTLNSTPVEAGRRYRLTVTLIDNTPGGPSDIPELDFGGTIKTDLVIGENIYEVIADTTESSHVAVFKSAVSDTCWLVITVVIQEITGG